MGFVKQKKLTKSLHDTNGPYFGVNYSYSESYNLHKKHPQGSGTQNIPRCS